MFVFPVMVLLDERTLHEVGQFRHSPCLGVGTLQGQVSGEVIEVIGEGQRDRLEGESYHVAGHGVAVLSGFRTNQLYVIAREGEVGKVVAAIVRVCRHQFKLAGSTVPVCQDKGVVSLCFVQGRCLIVAVGSEGFLVVLIRIDLDVIGVAVGGTDAPNVFQFITSHNGCGDIRGCLLRSTDGSIIVLKIEGVAVSCFSESNIEECVTVESIVSDRAWTIFRVGFVCQQVVEHIYISLTTIGGKGGQRCRTGLQAEDVA